MGVWWPSTQELEFPGKIPRGTDVGDVIPHNTYPGFNVLLFGPAGTGKTYSIHTLVEAGLETYALFLEPGIETLIGYYADQGKTLPKNLHFHYLKPKTHGFDAMKQTADQVGKFDLAGLAKMKDMKRSQSNQMVEVLGQLNSFTDQRDGSNHGPVDTWGNDKVLVIDSLSALNRIAMDTVVGTKPVKDQSDWGIAQTLVMNLLHRLTSGCMCHFVLIGHVDREADPVMGGVKLLPSTLGKALISQITQPFSDVILAGREGDKFHWDTASALADVKTRNLPIASKLPASFETIWSKWEGRKALATGIPA